MCRTIEKRNELYFRVCVFVTRERECICVCFGRVIVGYITSMLGLNCVLFNSWENKNRYSTIALRNLISIARLLRLQTSLQSRNIYIAIARLYTISLSKSYSTFLATSLEANPSRTNVLSNTTITTKTTTTTTTNSLVCKNLPLLKKVYPVKFERESVTYKNTSPYWLIRFSYARIFL